MAGLLGLGLTDIDTLEYLERFGPMTHRELGQRLLLTSGAVTLLVDRLEKMSLVRRSPHPSDRRASLVELESNAALPELPELQAYHVALRSAAKKLSAPARQEVAGFLEELAQEAENTANLMRARSKPRSRSAKPEPE